MVALIGANGAGKTTLLRAISGLKSPQSGQIHFKGSASTAYGLHQIVRWVSRTSPKAASCSAR